MEPLPTRDLSIYRTSERPTCSACGEDCTEDDPTWESQPVHLFCVDLNDVRAVVEAGYDSGYLVEAAVIARMLSEEASQKLQAMRDRREALVRRGGCVICQGHGKTLVTAHPYPVWADCGSCEGSGRVR